MALRGMVATPHALATQTGLRILREGGNAVEAAIAAAATIAVVYPHMNSLGGDNVWLIYNAVTREVRGLNATGRSAAAATIGWYRERGITDAIPPRGFLAANTVPGCLDGWAQAYAYSREALGGRLPWGDLLADAIHYADDGFPVTRSQEECTAQNLDPSDDWIRHLQRFEGFRQTYLRSDGRPVGQGQVMRLRALALTLRELAREGAEAFYRGSLARRIADFLHRHGSPLTAEDFATHTSTWVEPLRTTYRSYTALSLPPNTQGVAALSLLNLLETHDLTLYGDGSPDYLHLMVEATKLAFADRDRWVTDPDWLKGPLPRLLDKAYARERAARISMSRAQATCAPGITGEDTVALAVVDGAGNAVSLMQSIYFDFGSGIVAGDSGVLMQNRGSFFSLDPAHVNALAPRKRTFHTLIPAMLLADRRPYLVYGTMGGEGQPQTQAALVTRVVDFGYDIQAAIEAPRWLYGRTWGLPTRALYLEGRFSPATAQELTQRGHPVQVLPDWSESMGHAQGILIDTETGVRY
ncbi:MAG: gamma-glutamyltransferase, partial [candidate division NC10 bacterium]|nr:gamma-glutamyltransferase [candidate division NC10 bacterium]